MKLNPILKKDMTVRSRSMTSAMIVCAMNIGLFAAGLLGSFGVVAKIRETMVPEYGNTLKVYAMTVLIEYILIILMAPLYTVSAISGEREAGTLDLLLITNETPGAVIRGKLCSSLLPLSITIISGLPALMTPLLFGGVSVYETLKLIMVFIPEALFMLCIGIFASSVCRSTAKSTALAYGMLLFFIAGTIALPLLTRGISPYGKNGMAYLLLINPLFPVIDILLNQIGEQGMMLEGFRLLNLLPEEAFLKYILQLCFITAVPVGFLLFVFSILNITPGKSLLKNIE